MEQNIFEVQPDMNEYHSNLKKLQQQIYQSDNQKLDQEESNQIIFKDSDEEDNIELLMQNQKYFKDLQIISHLDETKANNIGMQLHQLNQLNSLELVFKNNTIQTPSLFKQIGQNLIHLKNLEYFSITIEKQDFAEYDNDSFVEFGEGLRYLTNLKVFKFSVYSASCIGEKGAKSIKRSLKMMKQLTELKLYLAFTLICDDQQIQQIIFKGLKYLKNLNKLDLTIGENLNFNDSDLSQVSLYLKNLVNLQCLNFTINDYNDIKGISLLSLKDSVSVLKNLNELHIIILNNNIVPYFIFQLQEQLFQIENIQVIEFSSDLLTELASNYDINHVFWQNPKLSKIKFFFNFHRFAFEIQHQNKIQNDHNLKELQIEELDYLSSEQDQSSIINLLKSSLNLEVLTISIVNYMSEQFISQMGSSLQNLTNLKELSISLNQKEQMDNKIFLGISKLSQLSKLQLQLNFSMFEQKDQNDIVHCFQKLENLKELKLFDYSQNSDLSVLGQAIKHLVNLVSLELFYQSHSETINFEFLANSLKQLVNLEQLVIKYDYFWIYGNRFIQQEQILKLFNGIKHLKNLSQIYLDTNFNKDSNSLIMKEFSNTLQSLKQLRTIFFFKRVQNEELSIYLNLLKRKNSRIVNIHLG